MSATRQTTIWCDAPGGCVRFTQLDTGSLTHARKLASGEGWGRMGRHGDCCPKHNPDPRVQKAVLSGLGLHEVPYNWPTTTA